MTGSAALVLAGGLSGICVDLLLFPLDTLKTRLQVRGGTALPPFSVRVFYRGLLSSMLSSFPCAATFWLVYKGTEAHLRSSSSGSGSAAYALAPMAASSLAEACVCAIRTPFDIVKQQLQAGQHGSTAGAVRAIVRAEGLRGLYAGFSSAVIRDIPFAALQFSLYDALKRGAMASRSSSSSSSSSRGEPQPAPLHWLERLLYQSTSAAFAGGATTPLDVVKTRLMTQSGAAGGKAQRYLGWWDCLRTIVREEGAGALLNGFRPRVLWLGIGGAVFMGSFEALSEHLGRSAQLE